MTTEVITTFQRWLSRHFVALVLIYWHLDEKGNSKGKPFVAPCSCFVMSFGELWFLVTAGHVLEKLDQLVGHRHVKVVDSFLMDSLGSQAQHQNNIPFSYAESNRHWIYEDGLDFGFIGLDGNAKRLMQANGIEPIAIQNWIGIDIERCFSFALLGIPAELVEPKEQDGKQGIWIGTFITSVKRLTKLPDGAEETEYERFVGEITKENALESLEGVSGGPIVGFYKEGDDTRYWVVAMQSHCLGKKYVFGCPVKTFGSFMLAEMKSLIESGQLSPEVMGPIAGRIEGND